MDEISKRTLRHYEERADAFWEGTRDHDVTQNIEALLSCLPEGGQGQRVLDFGCGPGRDLKALTDRGTLATGLDGCEAFCAMAFKEAGLELRFEGAGADRKGVDAKGRVLVEVDPRYLRPTEGDHLLGDPSKARERLGWEARCGVEELASVMVAHDLELAAGEARALSFAREAEGATGRGPGPVDE